MQAYVFMCLAKVNGEAAKEGTSNGYSMITQKPWLEDWLYYATPKIVA